MNETSGFQRFLDAVRLPVFILVIIAALVVGYVNQSAIMQALNISATPSSSITQPTVSLTQSTTTSVQTAAPAPASQAQITVDNPNALPTSVTTAQIVPFSFTIQNTGATTATFQYKVYAQWQSGEQDVIDENVVTLSAGQSQSIPEALKFEEASDKAEILIEVPTANQKVQFALPAAK